MGLRSGISILYTWNRPRRAEYSRRAPNQHRLEAHEQHREPSSLYSEDMVSFLERQRNEHEADWPDTSDQGLWRVIENSANVPWHICRNPHLFISMNAPNGRPMFGGKPILGIGDACVYVKNVSEGPSRRCRKILLQNTRYIPEYHESVICLRYSWSSAGAATRNGGHLDLGELFDAKSYLYDDKDHAVAETDWCDGVVQLVVCEELHQH